MPCALLDFDDAPTPCQIAAVGCGAQARTGALCLARECGRAAGGDAKAQARAAHEQLRASGWTDAALRAGALSVDFDLWRAVAVTYASSYGRYGAGEHPCGYSFAAMNADLVRAPPPPPNARHGGAMPAAFRRAPASA